MKAVIYIISISLMWLFGACSTREEPQSGKTIQGDSAIIRFCKIGSRATDTQFENGDAIGVFAAKRSSPNIVATLQAYNNFAQNKKFVYQNGYFYAATSADEIDTAGNRLDFYVYYPYQTVATDTEQIDFSVQTDQTTHQNLTASDFMFATNLTGISVGSVPLNFEHLFTKIRIIPDTKGMVISNVKLIDVCSSVYYDMNRPPLYKIAAKNDIQMFQEWDGSFSAIVPRQSINIGTLYLQADIDGSTRQFVRHSKLICKNGEQEYIPLPYYPVGGIVLSSSEIIFNAKLNTGCNIWITIQENGYSGDFTLVYETLAGAGYIEAGSIQTVKTGTAYLKFIPTQKGDNSFRITVIDEFGQTAKRSFTARTT